MLSTRLNGHAPRKSLSRVCRNAPSRKSLYRLLSSSSQSPAHRISSTTTRSIATAVEHPRFNPANLVPFHPSTSQSPVSSFSEFDLLQESGALSLSKLDLQRHMHACLLVGQFERAEAFLRKAFASRYDYASKIAMNNAFLRGLTSGIENNSPGVSVPKVLRWFDWEMPLLGLNPNADSFAIVCRVVFLQPNKLHRARLLRRYLENASKSNLLRETLSSGEFTDHEWSEILQIRPEYSDFANATQSTDSSSADRATVSSSLTISDQTIQSETSVNIDSGDSSTVSTHPEKSEPRLEKSERNTSLQITATGQRGLGLQSLKAGLKFFNIKHLIDADELTLATAQRALETQAIVSEVNRWKQEHLKMSRLGRNPSLFSNKSLEPLLWEWKALLEKAISDYFKEMKHSADTGAWGKAYCDYFAHIPADKLAAITIMKCLLSPSQFGDLDELRISSLALNISSSVQYEGVSLAKSAQFRRDKARMRQNQLNRNLPKQAPTDASLIAKREEIVEDLLSIERMKWPYPARVTVGAFLISKLAEVAYYPTENDEKVPAFWHELIWKNGKRLGVLRVNEQLRQKISDNPLPFTGNAHHLPMVAKPLPWAGMTGAYLNVGANLMRHDDLSKLQHMYLQAAISNNVLGKVFNSLNAISETPWKINQPLLRVMVSVWNTGEALTSFPPANAYLEYPDPPPEDADKAVMKAYRYRVKQLNDIKSGYQSNRCFINLQLEIAQSYSGIPFYTPHNLDFRGRAYPVPGLLNHMNADHARALFLFAQGRELGEHGLKWLKIHLASVYGLNKATFDERQKFVDENMENIRDSVSKPLDGQRWWMKGDDPWQVLASSMEIVAALDSADPSKYVSHFPVHQDGTCNGLQHYAALGGDILGATQVNLIPGDRPADIYGEVAKIVKTLIEEEVGAEGVGIAKEALPLVTRQLVKRPVMTNVYGVTFPGAVLQVRKEIDNALPVETSETRPFSNTKLALYITRKIFKAFGDLFAGAGAIQHWLAKSASLIASSVSPEQLQRIQVLKSGEGVARGHPLDLQSAVVFTTPLGLPVVQPYRSETRSQVKTALQHLSVQAPRKSCPVLKRRQKAALPPNFIHSLDATHMMLTATKMKEAGLSFSAVHDSYWTHAADVPSLNQLLRSTFVEMHAEDVMERLRTEFDQRYKGFMCIRTVPSDSPLGKKIKALRRVRAGRKTVEPHLRKFFKKVPFPNELLLEYERSLLLQSQDLEDVARGEALVTPATLFASMQPGDMQVPKAEEELELELAEEELELAEEIGTLDNSVVVAEASSAESGEKASTESVGKAVPPPLPVPPPRAPLPYKQVNVIKFWTPTTFPPLPKRGDFDVSAVLQSDYFFS